MSQFAVLHSIKELVYCRHIGKGLYIMLTKRLFSFFTILPLIVITMLADKFFPLFHHAPFMAVCLVFQILLTAELITMSGVYYQRVQQKKQLAPLTSSYFQGFDFYFPIVFFAVHNLLVWLGYATSEDNVWHKIYVQYQLELLFPLFGFIILGLTKLKQKDHADTMALFCMYSFVALICGYIFPMFIKLKTGPSGFVHLFFFTSLIFANDSLAYVGGKLFGKHKAGISASPNKSVEGFVSGIVGSWIALFLFHLFVPSSLTFFHSWPAILTTGVVSLLCPVGDLLESMLKRSANIKHSGDIMPGRGGIFDSLDSLLFLIPVYYTIYNAFI